MESTANTSNGNKGHQDNANKNAQGSSARVDQLNTSANKAIDRAADTVQSNVASAADKAHVTADKAASALENGATTVHNKIDSVIDAARPAVDRLLTGAHQAVDKISDLAGVAKDTVSEKSVQLKDAHAKMMENGRIQVREKPAVSIGIAVAAGFVLAKLLGSRKD